MILEWYENNTCINDNNCNNNDNYNESIHFNSTPNMLSNKYYQLIIQVCNGQLPYVIFKLKVPKHMQNRVEHLRGTVE